MFNKSDAPADVTVDVPATDAAKGPTVAKPFQSHNRRFKNGDEISRADLAGTSLDWDHLVAKGFISA